jgi:ribosomal protein S18 acetylase RimI-like enzyme
MQGLSLTDVTIRTRKEAGAVFRRAWSRVTGVSAGVLEDAWRVSRQKWGGPHTWNRVVSRGGPQGPPVGVMLCERQWRKRRLCINYLAVDPSFQRRGVATMLLNDAKRLCAKEGLTSMWLFCTVGNDAGNALYKRFGFTKKRETELDGDAAYLYEYHME